jgi:hypothetical protein
MQIYEMALKMADRTRRVVSRRTDLVWRSSDPNPLAYSRLEGLVPIFEDWHTKQALLIVSSNSAQ